MAARANDQRLVRCILDIPIRIWTGDLFDMLSSVDTGIECLESAVST